MTLRTYTNVGYTAVKQLIRTSTTANSRKQRSCVCMPHQICVPSIYPTFLRTRLLCVHAVGRRDQA